MLLYRHSLLFFAMEVVDMMIIASQVYHESASSNMDTEHGKNVISHIGGLLSKQNFPEWNMLLMIALT